MIVWVWMSQHWHPHSHLTSTYWPMQKDNRDHNILFYAVPMKQVAISRTGRWHLMLSEYLNTHLHNYCCKIWAISSFQLIPCWVLNFHPFTLMNESVFRLFVDWQLAVQWPIQAPGQRVHSPKKHWTYSIALAAISGDINRRLLAQTVCDDHRSKAGRKLHECCENLCFVMTKSSVNAYVWLSQRDILHLAPSWTYKRWATWLSRAEERAESAASFLEAL